MEALMKEVSLRAKNTIICAGYARLPKSVTADHSYGVLGVELEVDPSDSKVVDAACTIVPSLGERFILDLLIGYDLEEGIDPIVSEIQKRYFNVAQKAVISAIDEAYRKYLEFKRAKVDEELKKLSSLS
ncbi:DUF3870 domain-containing protein [Nitrospinae bacterium AH_259_B05_G02_I21]|nr:DUF3870 domain-containing protein [Nitrospinae bacterium AH_259_B05_G02_I21]